MNVAKQNKRQILRQRSKNMETVTVTMQIDTENVNELKRILDHHIDYVLDMDNNTDIISSVHNVKVKK